MSIYEASITNPKKQMEFYKDLSEDLRLKCERLEKCFCNRSGCSGRIKDSRKYDSVVQQLDKYKEVIEEVREKLKLQRKVALSLKHPYTVSNIDEVLQILDKVKEVK